MQLLVNIDVDDLDRAVEFYSAIGLRLVRRLFEGSVAEMAGGNTIVHLLLKPAGSPPATAVAARTYDRHWTPVHLDFQIEDIDAALRSATAAGGRQESGIRTFAWGRLATLSDPFGNGFCLVQLSETGYDGQATA